MVTWPFDVIRMFFPLLLQVRVRLLPARRKYRFHSAGPSPAKPPAIQKRLLLRRRDPAKHGVAVREAAEAADDIEVKLGILEGALVSGSPAEIAAALLVGQRFRVHVGEIEERPLRLGGLAVETALDRAARRGAGERIGGVHGGAAAEHIARKLVEHDDVG